MSTFRFLFLLSAIVWFTEGCRCKRDSRRRQRVPTPRSLYPTSRPGISTRYPPPRQINKGMKRASTTKPLPQWMQTKMTKITPKTTSIPVWLKTNAMKSTTTSKQFPPWMQTKATKTTPTTKPLPSWNQPEMTRPPRASTAVPKTSRRRSTTTLPRPTPSIQRVSSTASSTTVNPKLHPEEKTSSGSPYTDSSGGNPGDTNDGETQLPLCRTAATTTVMCISGKTTDILAGSPLLPPPQTALYFHWVVEAFLALLLVIIAIYLAVKMRSSRASTGEGEPERLIVSGTTSYEEIGSINHSRRSNSTVTPDVGQSPVATCEQIAQPELAVAAGNLYENAHEITRPRGGSVHTYENIDAILYEDMRRQLEQQTDGYYEKLQLNWTTPCRPPHSESSGFYNALVDAKPSPVASDTTGGMKHSVTTDLERFADCSDESGGHM